jgi:hypothetical protein
MFVVTEAEAAAIRTTFKQRGEFAAAVEVRRLFPAITDTTRARECAWTIAGWKPLPSRPRPVKPPRSEKLLARLRPSSGMRRGLTRALRIGPVSSRTF